MSVCLIALGLGSGCRRDAPAPAQVSDTAITAAPPCVYFEDLRAFLPAELQGYQRIKDEGSTGKYGEVSVSEAERVFKLDEDRQISVRIVDTTIAKRLGKSIRDAAADASQRAKDDPTAPISGEHAVGFVRFDPSEQKAEANLWVGDRYVVAVSSIGFESTTEVRQIATRLDLAGLSKLR